MCQQMLNEYITVIKSHERHSTLPMQHHPGENNCNSFLSLFPVVIFDCQQLNADTQPLGITQAAISTAFLPTRKTYIKKENLYHYTNIGKTQLHISWILPSQCMNPAPSAGASASAAKTPAVLQAAAWGKVGLIQGWQLDNWLLFSTCEGKINWNGKTWHLLRVLAGVSPDDIGASTSQKDCFSCKDSKKVIQCVPFSLWSFKKP